jgi:DNA-binding response OmpR family regulator
MTKKILIAEDEEDIVELLCAIFDDLENCETFCAKDGEDALGIARVNNPDIIVLDIQLPRLDGYEMCKLVKSDPTIAQTKIIMLSGMVQNSDRLRAHEAGADDYIKKPFSPTELIEKVEKLLRNDQGGEWNN